MVTLKKELNGIVLGGISDSLGIRRLYIKKDIFSWLKENNIDIELDLTLRYHDVVRGIVEIFYLYLDKISEPNIHIPIQSTYLKFRIIFKSQDEMNLFLLSCR